MNLLNRAIVTLLAVFVLVAAGLVLLVIVGLVRPDQLALGSWLRDGLALLTQRERPEREWALALSLTLLPLSLLILLLELRPRRRKEAAVLLKQDESGRVTVAREGVQELATREATRVEGVLAARSQVTDGQGGLRVLCRVSIDPTANVPRLCEEIQERVKTAVEHHLGRPVAEVSVQVAPATEARSVPRVR
jgi:uncharacterized alkaline shock family protein YloU